jgi:hypothetical protein
MIGRRPGNRGEQHRHLSGLAPADSSRAFQASASCSFAQWYFFSVLVRASCANLRRNVKRRYLVVHESANSGTPACSAAARARPFGAAPVSRLV